MTNTTLVTVAFRIHPLLKRRIEREAKRSRLKFGDYLRRSVEDAFSFDPDACETDVNDCDSDIITVEED